MSKEIVDDFFEWLKYKCEDATGKMKITRGKVHEHLGVTLDYSTKGKVMVKMIDYIKKMVDEFPYQEEVKGQISKVPATENLFKVNPKGIKLDKEKAEAYHTSVAKGLFVAKRSRGDILPTIAYLCTRVKEPDEDDWKKLIKLLKYLNGTREDYLTLEADNPMVIKWYADASFAVHHDMKSHTGGIMTMGEGAVQCYSSKQKINTKSSTEAELVGADDVINQLIWTKRFLAAQGYDTPTILYQDNTSAIQLEKNGRESSGKRTRHLDIRFYYIKDVIQKGIVKVEYCSTDEMDADYMSKPLFGVKFKKFKKRILNQ